MHPARSAPRRPLAPDGTTERRPVVLIVDDTPQNLMLLGEILRPHARVLAAKTGADALRLARAEPRPDLVLLDIMMPEMDGHEVLRRLEDDPATQALPVIFITAMAGEENEQRGLEAGAVDYISKPFVPAVVVARVRTHLELKFARDRLTDQNAWLEAEIARRMQENEFVRDLSMHALAALAEVRDTETGVHLMRTQGYVEILARAVEDHPGYAANLADGRLEGIVRAAPLHDVGKVGIPDTILLKPGRLTPEEFDAMKAHTVIGARAIRTAVQDVLDPMEPADRERFSGAFAFMDVAQEIALTHHERWDGSGYPNGLAGTDIPVSGRLMAVADVFDALVSKRVYKEAMSFEQARDEIVAGRGSHFDPVLVDAFLEVREAFEEIARRHVEAEG